MGKLICTVLRGLGSGNASRLPAQLLENKARFIAQIITGEVTARSADDVGDTVLTAAEVKAIASGNPRVFEHFSVQNQCAKLERVRQSWEMTRHSVERKRAARADAIAMRDLHSADIEVARSVHAAHAADAFALTLARGVESDERDVYTEREAAGVALDRLARHTEATAKAQRRAIHCAIGAYRGFALWLDASQFTLRAVELRLVCEHDGQRITACERVLDDDLTARGIIASIDASLRDLNARIVRNNRLNDDDTQQIAACDAELERTQVWEHAERYAHLQERLRSLTAELRASSDAAAPTPATAAPPDATSSPVEEAAIRTDAVEATALPADDMPVEGTAVTFTAEDIPPAPRSLALLAAPVVAPAPVLSQPEVIPPRITPTPSPRRQSTPVVTSTPPPHAPRFGDRAVLAQQRRVASAKNNRPTPPPADTAMQLDLFAA